METSLNINNIQRFNIDGIRYLSIMYSDLAIVHYIKNDFENALKFFIETIEYFEVLRNKDLIQGSSADSENIKKIEDEINYAKEKIVSISNSLGLKEIENKNFKKAKEYFEIALSYDSHNSAILLSTAKCLKELGAFHSAATFAQYSYDLNPEKYEALKILGEINFRYKKETNIAIECFEKYIEHIKNDSSAYCDLASLYMEKDGFSNLEKQKEYLEKALELDKNSKTALRNLSLVLLQLDKTEDALKCYEELFKLGAAENDYYSYGCLKLKQGDFEEGWKYFEHRLKICDKNNNQSNIKKPFWSGKNNPNKTLLIQCEEFIADSIMFARYIKQTKPFFKKIIFRVQDELVDLFKMNFPECKVIGQSNPVESLQFDYQIPLMSLPGLMKTNSSNVAFAKGYLHPNSEKVQTLKQKYFNNDCIKIGISSNQDKNEFYPCNEIPLETFLPLCKLKNVKIYSLQKNCEETKVTNNCEIINLGNSLNDFSDTAAAISNLDIIISGDNCTLNLSGALGKKSYLLLPKISQWKWFSDTHTTPWYESVRIFRQKKESQNWDELISEIIEALKKDYSSLIF